MAKKHPDIVRRAAEGGHALGNHSWDHSIFPLISNRERREQIRACASALAQYGQRLFRPHCGHQSLGSRLDAVLLGYEIVGWSVDCRDWCNDDSEAMADRLIAQIQPGSVILLHDRLATATDGRCFNREPTLGAVKLLPERVGDHSCFVTVPELLLHGHRQVV